MPDENRVFDVTKPKDVSPSATSKPVIVGHQPQTSDPMVKDNDKPAEEPTYIKVVDDSPESDGPQTDDHSALDNSPVPPVAAAIFSEPSPEPPDTPEKDEPADYLTEKAAPEPAGQPEPVAEPAVFPEAPVAEPADEPTPPDDEAAAMPATAGNSPPPHIEELHFSEKNLKRSWWKPALLVLLLLLIGAYLAIDSGLVRGYSHLPFHIFKQKTAATTSFPPAPAQPNNQPAANAPSIPAGFKDYQLSGTNLTFAAPLSWGSPTSAADPGYSKRAAGQQSDGTHAYLVNFATNKDIQLAITSSKYLPPARDAQYYDYLQWCTGTNDGQFYQSTLHFTTTAGTDTPSTIVCDQGPLTAAAQLDSKTLVQSRVANISGKLIGDIYTENLSDPSLVVIRVKDAAMTNAAAIKQLLGTIQFSNAQ